MRMISISAPNLAALQQGFERAPERTRAELLAAMIEATQFLERELKDTYPRSQEVPVHPLSKRTPKRAPGETAGTIFSDAFSTPAGVLGVVASPSPIAAFLELGTAPHEILPRDAKALAFPLGMSGGFLTVKGVHHPGTKAQAPFRNMLERQMGALSRIFEGAAQNVAAHLARDAQGGKA